MNARESKLRRIVPRPFVVAASTPQKPVPATARGARAILQSITDFYGSWNVSSPELCFSERWLASLGYSSADMANGQGFFERIIHPDDRAVFESQFKAHLAGNAPVWDCECRICTKAGTYRWFEIRAKVTRRNKHGAPVQLAGMVLDIQARKQQQAEQAVWNDELSIMFQNTTECIWIVDPVQFHLVAFNKAYEDRMLKTHGIHVRPGMRPEEINSESARTWEQFYNKALEQAKVGQDCQHRSNDAALRVVSKTLVRNGKINAICLFGQDITPRTQLERALRHSEEKFAKAFLQSPISLTLTSAVDHRFIDVNSAFEQSTGYRREEVVGKSALEIGTLVDPQLRMKLIEGLNRDGSYRTVDIDFRTKSGEVRQGIGSAALIDLDGEPCMLGVCIDLTEQKRAIEALRESEERLSIAIESGHMYAFEWDPATDIVRRSSQSAEILGWLEGDSQHTKRELIERIHADDRAQYESSLRSLTAQEPTYKKTFRFLRCDGTTIWLEESGRAFFAPDGTLRKVVGITSNVTEIRESERTLRELSGRLISSQEEERRRIARELHDNIGQELALLCVRAQRIDSGEAAEQQTDQSDVHELYQKIKAIATEISKLSHRLHSSELNFLGLGVAAERLCRDFADQHTIDVSCSIKNLPPKLDSGKSLCFYRVLQEALQNIAKHSQATRVVVELESRKSELILKVSDNGIGFDTGKAGFGPSLGLISVRERLNLVGGRFALGSKAGYGTTLTANVAI